MQKAICNKRNKRKIYYVNDNNVMSNKKTLQTQAVKKKKEYSKEKGKDLVINIAHNTNTNS